MRGEELRGRGVQKEGCQFLCSWFLRSKFLCSKFLVCVCLIRVDRFGHLNFEFGIYLEFDFCDLAFPRSVIKLTDL